MEKKIIKISGEESGKMLSDWLEEHGYNIIMPCGGRGVCRNCRVELGDGGEVLACRTVIPCEGMRIVAPEAPAEVEKAEGMPKEGMCFALDIGTTTLVLSSVDKASGKSVGKVTMLNPEHSCGADVMSRILACKNGKLDEMRNSLLRDIKKMMKMLGAEFAERMNVVGNPTMLHIFCGVSPEGMGAYPFTPAFLNTRVMDSDESCLPVGKTVILPSASAFIGSDITAGAFAVGLEESEISLLVDIGTNGEMLLNNRGKLTAASTAAGPALEGANISCGVGGISGAISKVYCAGGQLRFRTVDNEKPIGVCGCGLVDLIAVLLELGIVDETGFIEEGEFKIRGIWEDTDGAIISECDTGLRLTQKDVREFQLAKSAICAGMATLIKASGLKFRDIQKVYVAGGLGFYLNPPSAFRVGLIPTDLAVVLGACGNSALAGAERCLSDLKQVERIAEKITVLELNSQPAFTELFVENMMFPEGEC